MIAESMENLESGTHSVCDTNATFSSRRTCISSVSEIRSALHSSGGREAARLPGGYNVKTLQGWRKRGGGEENIQLQIIQSPNVLIQRHVKPEDKIGISVAFADEQNRF